MHISAPDDRLLAKAEKSQEYAHSNRNTGGFVRMCADGGVCFLGKSDAVGFELRVRGFGFVQGSGQMRAGYLCLIAQVIGRRIEECLGVDNYGTEFLQQAGAKAAVVVVEMWEVSFHDFRSVEVAVFGLAIMHRRRKSVLVPARLS
jgi:hypothetical protein